MPLFLYEDKNMSVTNQLEIDIKASSQKATQSIDALIGKLNQVNSALDRLNPQKFEDIARNLKGISGIKINVGSGSGGSGGIKQTNNDLARTKSLLDTLTATSNKANKGFLNLNNTMFKLAATWGMFYATAYPFIRLLNKAWQSAQSAMDYVETYNYYKVTMTKIFDRVGEDSAQAFQDSYVNSLNAISEKMTGFTIGMNGELLETYSKNLGADPERLMNYQARIGAVTNAVGLMGQVSVNTQKALSMLSQDLSSLTNTDLQSVMTNLQSGLIGQSRALYKYGIDITQATLKTYAYENGISKAVSAMSQSEKMQLRLLAILDQSKVAWGDMANTVNSVANQYRIFGQNVSNLARVFGNLFLPIISKVLPYLNATLITLRQLFTMLGFKIFGNNWLKDTLEGISTGSGGVGLEDLADEFDDVGDSADSAGKKAKKLKAALMGFDELNIINDQSNTGSGSGSGGGAPIDLSGAIEDALGDYEKAWNDAFARAQNKAQQLANRLMAVFKAGGFEGLGKYLSTKLADALNSIDWEKIYNGAKSFGTGLAQFLNGLIQPSTFAAVGKTVANSLNTAIYAALAFGEEFDFKKLGDAIAAYWNGIFENFDFAAFGRTVGIWVGGITKTIATALKNIKWDKLFDGIKEAIRGFFKGLAESGVTIGDIAIVIGALTVKKILKLAWGAAALKLAAQTLSAGIVKLLGNYFGMAFAADTSIGVAIATGLKSQLAKIGPMLTNMKAFNLGEVVFGDFSTLNAAMTTTFGALATTVTGIVSIIGGAVLAVHEFFDMWENGWDILSEILKDLGIALGAIGAVILGIATGPVAAVIAAVAAIGSTAAIVAHEKMPDVGETIYNVLSNPNGTPLSDIVDDVSEKILSISDSFSELGDKVSQNETLKKSMEDTADSILEIQRAMEIGAISVEEGTKKIEQMFFDLQNATENYYGNIATTILSVYGEGGVLEGALDNYKDVAERTVLLGKELTEEQQKYYDEYLALEDKTSETALELLAKATGRKDAITSSMEDAKNKINASISDINWEQFFDPKTGELVDEEGFKAELAKVTDAVKLSQENIDTAITEWNATLYGAMQTAMEQGDTELANQYQAMIDTNNAGKDRLKEEIALIGQDVTDHMQTDFLDKMKMAIGEADSFIDQQETTDKFNRAMEIISKNIEEQMATIGINGAGWGAEASDKIMRSLFDENLDYDPSENIARLSKDWQSIFDGIVKDVKPIAKDSGKQLVEGINLGIEEAGSSGTTFDIVKRIALGYDTQFRTAAQINSPSGMMKPDGEYLVDGVNEGIRLRSETTTAATMAAWAQIIKDSFTEAFEDSFFSIQEIFDELVPYFENTVFEDLNSALNTENDIINEMMTDELTKIDEDISTTFTAITENLTTTFTDTTTSVSDMFTTMWDSIKTTGIVSANSLASVFEKMIGNIANGLNSFLSSTEQSLQTAAAVAGIPYVSLGRVNSNITIPRISIPAYRIGGFPEDGLFFANHNEMVGQFSNGQTAVANNEQIVEGIRYGVQAAVNEALAPYLRDIANNTSATASNTEDIKNKPTQTFSDRDVARANIRGTRSMGLTLRTT